ncbi:MAG: type II secretion system F family protein [Armatimonadetes bacterium]|nr:type II secretion system F family protein [Armatimonadota bacterium]MDW8120938.1 type II secretion system F family protein [Armatimonadota bacterium]
MKASPSSVSRLELAMMCRQFAAMLSAGVDALRCVQVLRRQTDHPRLAEVLDGIAQSLKMGHSLAQSFARYPFYFSPLFVSMISQGEKEGILAEVMTKLAEYLEREAHFFSSSDSPQRFADYDVLVDKLRPLVAWGSVLTGVMFVVLAILWYLTIAGLLPAQLLGPNMFLAGGLGMLFFTLLFLRYRPPQVARCNFCGRPESVAGVLIPGDSVWICADCIHRSTQILKEHQKVVAGEEEPLAAPLLEVEETPTFKDEDWKVRGQAVFLSDESVSEDEKIQIIKTDSADR